MRPKYGCMHQALTLLVLVMFASSKCHNLLAVTFIVLLCSERCNAIKGRVVKGKKCKITTEFSVAILDKSLSIQCGGALLDERWVVTAAQCCKSDNVYVIAGNPTITWIKVEKATKIEISKCIPHDDYDPDELLNNIALIQLETPILQSSDVKFAALPIAQLPDDIFNWYPKCTIMGWGAITFGYSYSKSKTIRCALLEVIPSKECSKMHKGLPESIVCTRSRHGAACGADAGGPLICENVLYGVASYSGQCKSTSPGVYARVDTYLAFIQPHLLKEADSNVLNQAISVIVLACVHIVLLM